ncbi:tandem-95 repeat protein [bacterium]|nr:tandem-95 repeat protein [bacterium]
MLQIRQVFALLFVLAVFAVGASAQTAAPVLDPIGAQSVDEGQTLNLTITASDADATIPTLTTSTLPSNATFTDNGDGSASFSFTPDFTQAGSINLTFYANDIVTADIDSEQVVITVNDINQAPVLAAIGARSVDEGQQLQFTVSASDADGTIPALSAAPLPTNATFVDNLDGTGTFTFNPNFTQAGTFDVTFSATDGTDTDGELVTITVNNVNQAPVLATIGARSVDEGQQLQFTVSASDADGGFPALSAAPLPTNATFVDNLNGTGTFTFNPDFTQAGTFDVTFSATDGTDTDGELVTITVNNVNQAPVLAAIGARSVDEGQQLQFTVSASDADGTIPTVSAAPLPTNATFVDNLDGTGTFTFNPDFTQAGTFDVTFTATDGTDTDGELVTITVNNVNQAPVLATIGARSVDEGQQLQFTVNATDPDGGFPALSAAPLPTNATFVDNLNGTGTFTFNPDFTQAGTFGVTFTASDGTDTDDELVTITVNNVNLAPVLVAIGAQSIAEGGTLAFTVTASDPDGTIPALTASPLPTNATFTDNGNGTGSFSFTPDFTQEGSYDITFTASDGSLTDDELVTVTVTGTNQAPVLATIGARSVDEGQQLQFTVSATDADGVIPTLSAAPLPTNATFVDNLNGTGTFTFNPDFTQAGTFGVTFTASDGTDTDDELVTITVNNVNRAPVLATIGARSVDEGQQLQFTVNATDPDGGFPALSAAPLPTNATFVDNLNGTGTFTFNPDFTQAGTFDVTFTATDGTDTDGELVTITVNNVNQAPVLATIGARSVDEGQQLQFTVNATDPDGGFPALSAAPLPTNATFVDNGDGSGTFTFNPDFTQAGSFDVTFSATDGTDTDGELVTITVNNVNLAPTLTAIGAQSIAEGGTLAFTVTASDPDGTIPALTASPLPTNATFTDNGNGTGSFSFTPDFTQEGSYDITFTASDGSLTDDELVTVTVTGTNQAPVLATIGARSVDEGQQLQFTVSATDADGVIPTLSAAPLPTNATFVDNLNGTGTFTFNPDFTQAGTFNITFTAGDGVDTDDEIVAVTVNQVNLAPVLSPIGPRSTTEGITLAFTVNASDPDGNLASITAAPLPPNATFTDNGDGTGSFSFTPDFSQAGVYNVTFTATDDSSTTDAEVVTVTVNDAGNQPPVLAAIGAQSVDEGQTLNFSVSATDPDGTIQSLTATNVPANATFTDNGDGTGSFSFTPDFTQQGTYNVIFTATDNLFGTDAEQVTITVNQVNLAPTLTAIGAQSVAEGATLNLSITASDPDNNIQSITTSALPANATFVDNGNGTGTFVFNPDFTQAGSYDVTFTVTDDSSLTDFELVTITVTEGGNQAPVLAAIGAQSVDEGQLLTFPVSASDVDGTIQSLTATNLPTNATFTDNGDGTGSFSFTPDFTQQGSYDVTFTATDDGLATDVEIVTITVNQVNLAPTLAAIGAQSVAEGATLNLLITASDPDGNLASITTSALPANATFTDNGDGTGSFSFTPDFTQAGSYDVTFTATDDSSLTDAELVTISVTEGGNQAPTVTAIAPQSIDEGQNLAFTVTTADVDGTVQTVEATNLPVNATFTDNGDGTGSFSFTPDFTQQGVYNVTFTATDDGLATGSTIAEITVNQVNLAPVLDPIGPRAGTEGTELAFTVTASDPDGTIPTITALPLPTNATLTDNGDGTASFSFTPDFNQSGVYNITFTATDDSSATDAEIVTVTITEAGNQPPVLAAIGAQSVDEGQTLNFSVSATDPDGTIQSLTATNVPANATFTDNGDGTGSFSFTPDFTQQGTYNVIFTATDNLFGTDAEQVTITVNQINLSPTLDPIGAQSIAEGATLNVTVTASDPDGTTPVLDATPLPANATFTDNGDGTGSFAFTPDFTQAGTYDITFSATDDSAVVASELVTVTVTESGNQAPVITAFADTTIVESQTLAVTISAVDADAETPTLSAYELGGTVLPANAGFTDNGDGTGDFTFTPDLTQSGSYSIVFKALDASLAVDSAVVVITVNETNQAPVLAAIADASVDEGTNLTFGVSASDADGTIPTLSANNVPLNASFTDNLDGTGSFVFDPDFTQAGAYTVTFYAADGIDIDSQDVVITVNDAGNQTPVLTAFNDTTIVEGQTLDVTLTATDADGTIPTLTAENLPANATFTDNLDGTAAFSFTPDFVQNGTYPVTFIASDGTADDTAIVTITVNEAGNRPPVFVAQPDTSVSEGGTLTLTITSTDPDGTIPALSITTGISISQYSFIDNNDGTGTFTYTPDYYQAGTDSVFFIANDGGTPPQTAVLGLRLTTIDVNQAPTIETGGPYGVTVDDTLFVTVTAADSTSPAANPRVLLSGVTLPSNATFVDNGNNTGTFRFIPTTADLGQRTFSILGVDQGSPALSTTGTIVVNVVEVNDPPVFDPVGPQVVTEGDVLSLLISATDPDGASPPSIFARTLPDNATLVDLGDGTAAFQFAPDYTQAGDGPSALYSVTFSASDGFDVVRMTVLFQVLEAGDQAPVFDSIPSPTITEGIEGSFGFSASDPDGGPVTLSIVDGTLPNGASFTDNGDGTGTITWTPNFIAAGFYDIGIIVTDAAATSDTITVTLEVLEAGNQTPVLQPIPDTTVAENQQLVIIVQSTDADENPPIVTTGPLPTGATFVPSPTILGNGSFTWTPGYGDSGTHEVIFYAIDAVDPAVYDSQVVTITVTNVNQLPYFPPPGPQAQTVGEGDTLIVTITVADNDGDTPYIYANENGLTTLPANMTFIDNRDGTGTVVFTPDYTQGNNVSGLFSIYYIDFTVVDSVDSGLSNTRPSIAYRVNNVNQPPALGFPSGSGPFTISEGDTLSFQVFADDPDGGGALATITVSNLPDSNAQYNASFPNLGTFRFTPDFTQAGSYAVLFTATDVAGATDTQTVQITVTEAGNQAPVFTTVLGAQTVIAAGSLYSLPVTAYDPDLDALTTTCTPLDPTLPGASFVPSATGGTFRWQPDLTDVGTNQLVTFITSDPSGLADTISTSILVVNALRGDIDLDSRYTMNDLGVLVSYLFRNGPAPQLMDVADVNADTGVNLTDIFYLINFMYNNGPQPPQ